MRKSRFFQTRCLYFCRFFRKESRGNQNERSTRQNPTHFDMIIENADGEKSQILFEYPNIQPNNAILATSRILLLMRLMKTVK